MICAGSNLKLTAVSPLERGARSAGCVAVRHLPLNSHTPLPIVIGTAATPLQRGNSSFGLNCFNLVIDF